MPRPTRRPTLLLLAVMLLLLPPLAAVPPATARQEAYQGRIDEVIDDLDAFWSRTLTAARVRYTSPAVVAVTAPVGSECGTFLPDEPNAAYCRPDQTIYFPPAWFEREQVAIGDFAWVVVISHEWGHHVQNLTGLQPGPGPGFEAQADCLAGAYAKDAKARGRLETGDIYEAVVMSGESGATTTVDPNRPGAHPTNDDRISAFMTGYINGVADCDLPIREPRSSPEPPPTDGRTVSPPDLAAMVPTRLDLPSRTTLRAVEAGSRTLDEIAQGFPDPAAAAARLRELGWRGNSYRHFANDTPPPDGAGWVEISLHAFATVDDAAEALPWFADARVVGTSLERVPARFLGDQSTAAVGPTFNGDEVTFYVRRGALLIRATAVSPNGDPTEDAAAAATSALPESPESLALLSPSLLALLPGNDQMPPGLSATTDGSMSGRQVANTFVDPKETGRLLAEWGWRESAYRKFAGRTVNGTTDLDIAWYRFADPAGAAAALPWFADARANALGLADVPGTAADRSVRVISGKVDGGTETTFYAAVDDHLVRISAVSPTGDPGQDILVLLAKLQG